ncbi:DUF1450 domain-containing protein [Marinitoga sp. 38H-ov]|uniref:DUF1450 domain-containing protein n=1 Tax=Marinitoga sp. 38H-ov TaxID=1755814 RepID=UPI0013EBDE38|nr:DUF1450 domain-containing protein [Marinitoga sp. 38H-ov]KAF2956244.1 hypothetical protein AS160_00160 [Marinitoga sp. 38H-ov]
MIKLCKHNSGTEKMVEYFEKEGIEHTVENCLGECDVCHSKVFVKKDEEVISADTVEELISKI